MEAIATMDSLSLLLLISFVLAIIHIFFSTRGSQTSESPKLPPGPRPLPIIGNILQLGQHPHQALTNLSKIYGPIMSLKLGKITTIVISSPHIAKEALQKHDQAFSSRTIVDGVRALDHHKFSVVWLPPSNRWRSLRKACVNNIFSPQQLGSTEILRQRKVQDLLAYVQEFSKKSEALDVGEAAFTTILNLISNTFFSVDLARFGSETSQEFKDVMLGIMQEAGRPNVADFFSVCGLLDPQGVRARMTSYFKKVLGFIDGIMEERMRLRDLGMDSKDCRDVLDSFLDLMKEESSQLSRLDILHLFLDIFVAGVDTTSSTVEWAMTELLRNQEKLKKAKEELQEFIGPNGQFQESDIPKLPFLQAIVKETLRLHPPAPFLVPHKSNDNINIFDFLVPRNAQILVNVWAMGRDSTIWIDPNSFLPERFLEGKIDFNGHNFELIPFGAGRRICPGLPLASRSLHLILASLVYNYDWKLANGLKPEEMDMSEKNGITLHRVQPLKAIPVKVIPIKV